MSCRRSGSAIPGRGRAAAVKPVLQRVAHQGRAASFRCITPTRSFKNRSPTIFCMPKGTVPLLFTENETNNERLFGAPNASPYVKDGINNAW